MNVLQVIRDAFRPKEFINYEEVAIRFPENSEERPKVDNAVSRGLSYMRQFYKEVTVSEVFVEKIADSDYKTVEVITVVFLVSRAVTGRKLTDTSDEPVGKIRRIS